MKKRIVWEMNGFEKVHLKNNEPYFLDDELISSVHIEVSNDKLKNLIFEIKDDIKINQETYLKICFKAENLCLNIIKTGRIKINKPYIRVIEAYLFEEINLFDVSGTQEKLIIGPISYNASSFYENTLKLDANYEKNALNYRRIFEFLKTENELIKFLGLYEFLVELTNKKEDKKFQKEVTNYIAKYRKELEKEYPFHQDIFCCKDRGRKNIEDGITEFRNKIAHYERVNNIEKYLDLEKSAECFITPTIVAISHYLRNSEIKDI